jgi:hypothetical protein
MLVKNCRFSIVLLVQINILGLSHFLGFLSSRAYMTRCTALQIELLFFAKSTFFHAGQREKKYFFHAEITFF